MLSDVLEISKKVYSLTINSKFSPSSPIELYDSYRKLSDMILNTKTVANHYLALDFNECFLQNSSFGEPKDKWKFFLNKDLKLLNDSVKKYLLKLHHLSIVKSKNPSVCHFPLERFYYMKEYYGFVRDEYNIGQIDANYETIIANVLKLDITPKDNSCNHLIYLDVSTYQKRCALKKELHSKIEKLALLKARLETYLLNHYYLRDLLCLEKNY
jgi:hypothetical protein